MEKFQVLEINGILHRRIGIYSWHLTHPNHNFLKSKSTYWILFFLIYGFIISSALVILKNTSNFDFQLQIGIPFIAGFQCCGMFLGVGCNLDKVRKLHSILQKIVDEGDGEILNNYWTIEQKCRKYTSMISRYAHCEQFIYVSAMVKSIISVCMGDFDTSTWNLPYSLAVPFDQTKFWNWYLLWFIQCNIGLSYASSMVPPTAYFICCCLYVLGTCKHLELLLKSTRNIAEKCQDEENPVERRLLYRKLQEILSVSIGIHINLYDIFSLMAAINNVTIFAILPIDALLLAATMYQLEHSEFDAVAVSFAVVCTIVQAWPALFCYFATFTTERIAWIGKDAYFSKWYKYPPILQKYIIVITARSQDNVRFTGLGLIYCTLETFGKLLKSSGTYYLIFRNMANI